jgi:hypothetical protein
MTVGELVDLLRTHDRESLVVSTGMDDCGGAIYPTKAVFVMAGKGRVLVSGLHIEGYMECMLTEPLR